MGIYVNTNTQSIFAQRALGGNTFNLQKSIEKLSTGFRINKAADDAAGLSISEKLTSQIRGLEKAEQNIGDGISLVQTAEGALGVIQDNVQRIRELTVQAANGTNSESELAAIQREVNARVTTIGDISTGTEFNGKTLLTGAAASATAFGNTTLQTGSDQGQTTSIDFTQINTSIAAAPAVGAISENAVALNTLAVGSTTVQTVAAASAATRTSLEDIDDILDNVSRMRSTLGASQNSLESKADYLNVAKENAMSSRSRIKDVDVAKESSEMIKNQILQQSSAAMLSSANQTPQLALNLLP
jgi:flagellin